MKTRLAASIGAAEATALHRACMLDAIRLAESAPGCRRRLLLAGGMAHWQEAGIALPPGWQLEPQRGSELGERMERAFAEDFRRGASRVVIIGTDTPWMGRRRIRTALAWLDCNDAVLGPSVDGGYYLVGLRRPLPAIFRGIGWGSGAVLASTRRALRRARASYRLLAWDFDLDRPDDIERARQLLRRRPDRAPALAEWLLAAQQRQKNDPVELRSV